MKKTASAVTMPKAPIVLSSGDGTAAFSSATLAMKVAEFWAGMKNVSPNYRKAYVKRLAERLAPRIRGGQRWAEALRDCLGDRGDIEGAVLLSNLHLVEMNRVSEAVEQMHLATTRRIIKLGKLRQEWAHRLISGDPWVEEIIDDIPPTDLVPLDSRETWRAVCARVLRGEAYYEEANQIMEDPLIIVELADYERLHEIAKRKYLAQISRIP